MVTFCPNCKQTADLHEIGDVKRIECPECGWFEVQADSTFVACDEPPEQTKPAMPTPAMPEPPELAHGKGPASTSEAIPPEVETPSSLVASDKPDLDNKDDDDDLDEFEEDWGNVSITFED